MRRPVVDERELVEEAELDLEFGLVGDRWHASGSKSTSDGSSNPDAQLTLANARAVDLVAAGDRERWALAGDQFYVDFDISEANLPAGTRLALGTAVIEVTELPHDGCVKFSARFGNAAHRFVNTKAAPAPEPARDQRASRRSRARSAAATRSASSPRPSALRVKKAEFGFPGTPLREQLVTAVLRGVKTATAGLLVDYERDGDPLPEVGERFAVVDNEGRDVAVIEVTEVRVLADRRHGRAVRARRGRGIRVGRGVA